MLFEDRLVLNEEWQLFAEASYVSDPTFLDGLFEEMAQDRREHTNSIDAPPSEIDEDQKIRYFLRF